MDVRQGDVFWADLPAPRGSEAGFRRPVVVVQNDDLNRSRIRTVVCVPLTTNLRWTRAVGNVIIQGRMAGLPKDSVAIVSQIFAADRSFLRERLGQISNRELGQIFAGIDIVLGR